jgi:hypothetical protein
MSPVIPCGVDGGKDYLECEAMIDSEERFNAVIARAGGWEQINEITVGWAAYYSLRWSVIVDFVTWARLSTSRLDGSICENYPINMESVSEL